MDVALIKTLADHGLGYFIAFGVFYALAAAFRAGIPPLLGAYVKKLDADTENVKATTKAVVEIPATIEAAQQEMMAAFTSGFASVETRLRDQMDTNRVLILKAIDDDRHARTENSLRRIERSHRLGAISDLPPDLSPPTSKRRSEG